MSPLGQNSNSMAIFPIDLGNLEKYREQFNFFDRDGNGEIDTRELIHLLRAIGQNPSIGETENMIHEIDADGTGTINFDEFLYLMTRHGHHGDVGQQLKAAFRVFDKDKDGFISSKELHDVMTGLGERMTEDEVQEMLLEADADKNGLIDYEEFIAMMTRK